MMYTDATTHWLMALAADGRSPLTIRSYQSIVRIFERYLGAAGHSLELIDVTSFTVQGYLKAMRDAQKSPRTVDSHYTALASFLAWSTQQDFLAKTPTKRMNYHRAKPVPPRAIPLEQVYAALGKMGDSRYAGTASRDRMAVLLMLYTGARISEACSMTWANVKWTKGAVEIPQTKGGAMTMRWVPLHDKLRAALERHRAVVAATWPKCEYILQTRTGARADETWVQNAFRRRKFGFTPHHLRHSYATMLAKADVNLVKIQRYMGHASLDMTARYIAVLLMGSVEEDVEDLAVAF